MSLLKTALACVLLAVLAPWAGAQTARPASSKALGQISSFGGNSASSGAALLRAAAPQTVSYDSSGSYDTSESETGGESWTSDSPEFDTSEESSYASATGNAWEPAETPPSAWNGAAGPPTTYRGGGCPPGAACSGGYCNDGSQANASSWLGTYRFAGGNLGFSGPWYVSADAFLLHRSNGNAHIPITLDTNTGNTVLSTQNLQFTSRVGPRVMLGYAWSHTTAFEVSYFGLIDSRTQSGVTGSGNLSLPPDLGLLPTDFSFANAMNVSYASRLNNAEFNVLRNSGCCALSWLYGFRYLHLNEQLDINSQGLFGTGNYNIMTRNNMFGIQGGARYMVNYKHLALEATAKAGVLENATQQSQNIQDSGFPAPLRDTLSKGANVSFLGELGLNGMYRIGERWALRGGYTLIWVDGLALAPNQLDYSISSTSGTLLNHGGNLLLQAVSAGVEYHW